MNTKSKDILLLINRTAGTGHGLKSTDRLKEIATAALYAETILTVSVVDDHRKVLDATRNFLNQSRKPATIIVGGGGGTLNAVIQAICEGNTPGHLPGSDVVSIATLRMGSGNMVAKHLGVPANPFICLPYLLRSIQRGISIPCCIGRYELEKGNGKTDIRYAMTLAGFGQFGRIPGDLERWHHRFPRFFKRVAGRLGIEHLTNFEYGACLFIRSIGCVLKPGNLEKIELKIDNKKHDLELLMGMVMNFPIKKLPFNYGIRIQDRKLSLNFIPYTGRLNTLVMVLAPTHIARKAVQITITPESKATLKLRNKDYSEFFLDENPMVWHKKINIQVAGKLAFVPGPNFRHTENEEEL
jgi:diacylglycerol kinase family enzyme